MSIENQRIVIHRRGGEDIVWSSDTGLKGFSLTPFGVVAEFEDQELTSEFIPWSDVTKLQVFDSDYELQRALAVCPTCEGRGLLNDGLLLCGTCNGYGSVRKGADNELENK